MQYIQLQGQQSSRLDTPLEEGSFNLFIDSNDGAIKAKDSEGNITSAGGGGLVETTYTELYGLWDDAALSPGTYYKITNFRTCYDQPDYDVFDAPIEVGNYRTGSLSPIIVFALDSGSLAADAFQPEHPNDKIKYDIAFTQTEVTSNPAFGRIVYREDNQGNAFDYDFREVRFKRYNTYFSEDVYNGTISVIESGSLAFITGSGTFFQNFVPGNVVGILDLNNQPIVEYYEIVSIQDDYRMFVTGSMYSFPTNTRLLDANLLEGMSWKKSNVLSNSASIELPTFENINNCFGNTSTNTAEHTIWEERTFLLPNNVFRDIDDEGYDYVDNVFGHSFRNNTFNADCDSNRVNGDFYKNIINNDFDNNLINDGFYHNVIECDFQRNTINGEFHHNHFGDADSNEDFDYNVINASFYENFFTGENDFEYNIIKGEFYRNIIYDWFSKNNVNGFHTNVLEANFSNNTIDETFYGNKMYATFSDNVIGENVYDNNFYSNVEYNKIGSSFYYNNIGDPNDYGANEFFRNKIGNNFESNTIRQNFNDNEIDYNCYDNTFYSYVNRNTIGVNFYDNTIGELNEESYFRNNQIGYQFKGNLILGDFQNNRIADDFIANDIAYYFDANTIGDYFFSNDIGDDFQANTIGNYFEDNNIGDNFKNNKIGNSFVNNSISASFGRGVEGERRGNIIGNDFDGNIIGTYFWDNTIGNGVKNNIIGRQFQYNRIETPITGSDFTPFLGRINNVTYPNDIPGTNGSYTVVSGTTNGIGVNALFDVVVTNSLVDEVIVGNVGKLYEVGDTITIASGSFGGSADLVLTVSSVFATPMVYETYNKTIQRRFDGTPILVSLADDNSWYVTQYITEPID